MHTIDWCEVKKSKDGTKEWKEITVGGRKMSIWPDHPEYLKSAPGAVVSGDIVEKGNYINLLPTKVRTPYAGARGASQGMITKAMETKAHNIAAAQDRSAWMWAKNNATTLLSNYKGLYEDVDFQKGKKLPDVVMADAVIRLATKIYNGEPVEPFSSKPTVVSTGDDVSNDDINAELNNY